MTSVLPKSVRERHEREDEMLTKALRAQAKGLVSEINRERGEGTLYLSECLGVGFFMLFERMPLLTPGQRPDWARQLMIANADLEGYAHLVMRLEEMKGVRV